MAATPPRPAAATRRRDPPPRPAAAGLKRRPRRYERASIEAWLAAHDTSPLTNVQLDHKMLLPNRALKQAIDDMLSGTGRTPSSTAG